MMKKSISSDLLCSFFKNSFNLRRFLISMAVDDDVLRKNPFAFELATVVVNDSVTREAITKDQMRKLPMTDDVARCFQAIIEDREKPRYEKMIEGHTGFLFTDKNGNPLVAMHWKHRFNHMVKRYNDIFRVQMPNITPHICRYTYCSNMAKLGMNPKTLQYLMGHSDIGVTLNLENARKKLNKAREDAPATQKMFRAI